LNAQRWDEIKERYTFGEQSIQEIAREFDISSSAIRRKAKKRGWVVSATSRRPEQNKCNEVQTHAHLLSRLMQVFERQISTTEDYLNTMDDDSPSFGVADRERDARTLASLTRTLKQLEELRRLPKATGGEVVEDEGQGTDGDDMRAQLQRRLDQLAETGNQKRIPPQPDDN